jgi:hypothetical protein
MNPTPFIVCVLTAIALRDAPANPAVIGVPAATVPPKVLLFEVLTNNVPPGIYESAPFTCIVVVPDQKVPEIR